MNAPQIIWIALMAAGTAAALVRHRTTRTINAGDTLAAVGVHSSLLYWGGFFS